MYSNYLEKALSQKTGRGRGFYWILLLNDGAPTGIDGGDNEMRIKRELNDGAAIYVTL